MCSRGGSVALAAVGCGCGVAGGGMAGHNLMEQTEHSIIV